MDILLYIFLIAFSAGAGAFIGCGNRQGMRGSLIPGLVIGLIISIPMLRDAAYFDAALMTGCALVGSIIASLLPDANRFKRFSREQSGLKLRVGSFKLGK